MKTISSSILILLFSQSFLFSQIAINEDGSSASNSAMLDIKSSDKGFLLPRMTYSDLYAIDSPAEGLMVYCTDCNADGNGLLVIYTDGTWNILSTNCLPPISPSANTHDPSLTQIVWNWNAVPAATGYKWNTVNELSSATNMGNLLTYTEEGLTPNNEYTRYVWAINSCGNSSSVSLTEQTLPYSIGASYGGGIIFYIDGTGNHGLISATMDQSIDAPWGCNGTLIGGTSTEIGTGQANTTAIVNGCSETGIAARLCNDLVLNGYDDWFLPSKDEMTQMFIYKNAIGGFSSEYYFNSSECDANKAWERAFLYGDQSCWFKNVPHYVRAVRAF